MSTNTDLPEAGFVRLHTVLSVIPIGKSTWWAGIKAGKYPAPVKISKQISAWRSEDIRTLIESLGQAQRKSA